MRNLKVLILIVLIALTSCSKDDDPDIIIGKWRAIEKYESDIQVELPLCSPHFYTEYRADRLIFSYAIDTVDFPEACLSISDNIQVTWSNLGNNRYRIKHGTEEGQIFIFYKEGENLVKEYPDGITTVIYEPYL